MSKQGTGSFGASQGQVEGMIKAKATADQLQRNSEEIAKEAETTEQDRITEEVESQLPKTITSGLLGMVPYLKFKETYQEIWDQVAEKAHFLAKRVTYATKEPMGIAVQSMTQTEQRALAFWEPNQMMTHAERQEAGIQYSVYRLVVQLRNIEDYEFPDIPLTVETRSDWITDPAITQQYEWLMERDPQFITYLVELMNDLDSAKYLALVENLKNP